MGTAMTMRTVIRNASGEIINIGAWDFQPVEVPTGLVDVDGNPIVRQEPSNPMPEGAYLGTADIVVGWDGGLYEADDPRQYGPG